MSPTLTERNPSERPVHECPYCGATNGLRIARQDPRTGVIDPICGDCFTSMDDGPCFDDLPLLPIALAEVKTTRDWQRWSHERREYADPYNYDGGRW